MTECNKMTTKTTASWEFVTVNLVIYQKTSHQCLAKFLFIQNVVTTSASGHHQKGLETEEPSTSQGYYKIFINVHVICKRKRRRREAQEVKSSDLHVTLGLSDCQRTVALLYVGLLKGLIN